MNNPERSPILRAAVAAGLTLASIGSIASNAGAAEEENPKLGPGETICFDAGNAPDQPGIPGRVNLYNVTPVGGTQNGGFGVVHSSDVPAPNASNFNYGIGTVAPNVAMAEVGSDGQDCITNSNLGNDFVHIIADKIGEFNLDPSQVSAAAPVRLLDMRNGIGVDEGSTDKLGPGETICFDAGNAPDQPGIPGRVNLYNVTPVGGTQNGGFGVVHSSDVPAPNASNFNYGIGTVAPNVAMAEVGSDGQDCITNSNLGNDFVHIIADKIGEFNLDPSQVSAAAPVRLLDMRNGIGVDEGSTDKLGPGETICFDAGNAPDQPGIPGRVNLYNVTPVGGTQNGGFGVVHSSDVPAPNASNFNYGIGTVAPNVAMAEVGSDGQDCITNSNLGNDFVHIIADKIGEFNLDPSQVSAAAPVRLLDMRNGIGVNEPVGPGYVEAKFMSGNTVLQGNLFVECYRYFEDDIDGPVPATGIGILSINNTPNTAGNGGYNGSLLDAQVNLDIPFVTNTQQGGVTVGPTGQGVLGPAIPGHHDSVAGNFILDVRNFPDYPTIDLTGLFEIEEIQCYDL